ISPAPRERALRNRRPRPGNPGQNLLCSAALTALPRSSVFSLHLYFLTSLLPSVSPHAHIPLTAIPLLSPSSSNPAPPISIRALPPIRNPSASMYSSSSGCCSAPIG